MFESLSGMFQKKPQSELPPYVGELSGLYIALLATDGFEESELFKPKMALERAGAKVLVVSLKSGRIRSWKNSHWGRSIAVDLTLRDAWSVEFDSLVLPGGVMNPDKLRSDSEAVAFVMSFINKKKPIAAICHGAQTLIETGSLKGKKLTSWPSIKTDLVNAGAHWVDREVVTDHSLVTARGPADIPAFNNAVIKSIVNHRLNSGLPSTEGYVATL